MKYLKAIFILIISLTFVCVSFEFIGAGMDANEWAKYFIFMIGGFTICWVNHVKK